MALQCSAVDEEHLENDSVDGEFFYIKSAFLHLPVSYISVDAV